MKKIVYDIKITSGEYKGYYNYTDIENKHRAEKLARRLARRMQLTNKIVQRVIDWPDVDDDDIVTAFFKD